MKAFLKKYSALLAILTILGLFALGIAKSEASDLSDPAPGVDISAGIGLAGHFGHLQGRQIPIAVTWEDNKYEFVTVLVRNDEFVDNHAYVGLSRRVSFFEKGQFEAFVGVGGAYKTQVDKYNGSKLNYSLSCGVRLYDRSRRSGLELTVRHLSNAGLTEKNWGFDGFTLQYIF